MVVFSVHWGFSAVISQLWCIAITTWSFIRRNTKYVQKSAHNSSRSQTGRPPPDVIWNPHLLPGIGLFLRIPALFSRIPHSSAPRFSDAQMESLRRFWDAQKLIQIRALGLFRKSLFHTEFADRSGGLHEVLEMSVKSLDAVKRKIQSLQQQADDAQDRAQFLETQLDNERDLRDKVRKPPSLHSSFFLYCFCLLLFARFGPRWTKIVQTGASCHTLAHVSHGILAWCYTGACCHAAWKKFLLKDQLHKLFNSMSILVNFTLKSKIPVG